MQPPSGSVGRASSLDTDGSGRTSERGDDAGGRDGDDPGDEDAARHAPADALRTRGPMPTPMMALEMTWVVETGIPKCAVPRRTVAAVVSAANPWTGSSSTTRWPIVCMIRQPPTAVPSDSAVADTTMTQTGTSIGRDDARREQGQRDDAHRLLGVVGAVGEGHVSRRDRPAGAGSAGHRLAFRVPEDPVAATSISRKAPTKPRNGEVTIGMRTLSTMPWTLSAPTPAATMVAPSSPPMSAWRARARDGRDHQVMRFQAMAPRSAADDDRLRGRLLVDEPGADGLGHGRAREGADEVERGGHEDRVAAGGGRGSRPTSRSRWRCRGSR